MYEKNVGVNHLTHPSERKTLQKYLKCYYTVNVYSTVWMAFAFYGSWKIHLGLAFISLAVCLFLIVGAVGASIFLKRLLAPSFDWYQMKSDLKFLARLNIFIILVTFFAYSVSLVYILFYSKTRDMKKGTILVIIFAVFAGLFVTPFLVLAYYEKATAEALEVFCSERKVDDEDDDEVVIVIGDKYRKDMTPQVSGFDNEPQILMF